MLDYRINTFLTLYEEMNYRRTAEKLNMTQPGVTGHIHYLENYYGIKLFEYNGRTLSKTKNAKLLKKHIDSILADEHAIFDEFSLNDTIHLNVGATKTIGEFVIPPIVNKFLSKSRHNLDLYIDNTQALLQMLEHSELDFAIIEGIFDKSKYGFHLYKKENFVGICSKTHPFAGKTITLKNLFNENLLLREKGSGTRNLFEKSIHDKGFSLDNFKRCFSISSFSVICNLVINNNAITFAYEQLAHSNDKLSTFEVEDMDIKGEFNFVYCNERIARDKIKMFLGDFCCFPSLNVTN